MNQLVTFLLPLIVQYGYPIIFAVVFGSELGLPLPVSSILLAAGSFTVDGTLNIFILIPLVALTAIVGDTIGYWFGMRFGRSFAHTYLKRIGLTEKRYTAIHIFLQRWGIWCIFLSRWFITPLCIPVNVLSGLGRYPFKQFLIAVIIGETIWATMYIYLGYLFGINWVTLTSYFANAPLIILFILLGITAFIIAARMRKK